MVSYAATMEHHSVNAYLLVLSPCVWFQVILDATTSISELNCTEIIGSRPKILHGSWNLQRGRLYIQILLRVSVASTFQSIYWPSSVSGCRSFLLSLSVQGVRLDLVLLRWLRSLGICQFYPLQTYLLGLVFHLREQSRCRSDSFPAV